MSTVLPTDDRDVFTAMLAHPSKSGDGLLGGPNWNAELAFETAFDALALMRKGSTLYARYGEHGCVAFFWK